MGFYINPPAAAKEEFLLTEGKQLSVEEVKKFDFNRPELPVCLVDNGWMTAAGIAYDARERDVFVRPDGRPKVWFAVPREKLLPYLPKEMGGGI